MRIALITIIALGGVLGCWTPLSAEAGELLLVRRVRPIANPAPEWIPTEEVLEVTFYLPGSGWVPGLGWSLRYYDQAKTQLGQTDQAYLDGRRNSLSSVVSGRFKAQTVYILYFPLPPEAEYLVLALGDGRRGEVLLYPYSALLEDFNIPLSELNFEIRASSLLVQDAPRRAVEQEEGRGR